MAYVCSGVARPFPGGRLAHPEVQNEEENEEKLRKMMKNWGNVLILPTREWEAGYGPVCMPVYSLVYSGVHTPPHTSVVYTIFAGGSKWELGGVKWKVMFILGVGLFFFFL